MPVPGDFLSILLAAIAAAAPMTREQVRALECDWRARYGGRRVYISAKPRQPAQDPKIRRAAARKRAAEARKRAGW